MTDFAHINIVGLTGMSGAGKTTVGRIFSENGFVVIDCDLLARKAVERGSKCLAELERLFGAEILLQGGGLNRRRMAELVFSDKEQRERLNSTIYPYITYMIIDELCRLDYADVLLDAPTLFESGIDVLCDNVVSVVTERKRSVERIMLRDSISREQAEARLSSQNDAEFYRLRSAVCIDNNGSGELLAELAKEAAGQLRRERKI